MTWLDFTRLLQNFTSSCLLYIYNRLLARLPACSLISSSNRSFVRSFGRSFVGSLVFVCVCEFVCLRALSRILNTSCSNKKTFTSTDHRFFNLH